MAVNVAADAAGDAAADVLCVGFVCADLALGVPHHPAPDEKMRATSRLLAPGGPAACAAAQVARLGGRAAFAGAIGDDAFGALVSDALRAEQIDVSALITARGQPTALAAILVKPDGARSVVSHRPTPSTPPGLPLYSSSPSPNAPGAAPRFPAARVVLADGHRPEWTAALVAHARALGAPLVLDAGSFNDATRALAAEADHVVASEACALAALGGADPAAVDAATLRAALGAHRAGATLVVTLGARGLVWATAADGARLHTLPAFAVEAADTTGAGDAFHGAYALGLARGLPWPELLRRASAAGALACTRVGAWPSLATAAELYAFLAGARPR